MSTTQISSIPVDDNGQPIRKTNPAPWGDTRFLRVVIPGGGVPISLAEAAENYPEAEVGLAAPEIVYWRLQYFDIEDFYIGHDAEVTEDTGYLVRTPVPGTLDIEFDGADPANIFLLNPATGNLEARLVLVGKFYEPET